MKKILILLVILAGIAGIAYYKSNEKKSRLSRAGSTVTRELLLNDFEVNSIKKIHIKEDKAETTIAVNGDKWTVVERGGYTANLEKIRTVLTSLEFEKIKDGRRIGKDSWGKIGVNSPGDATAYGVGTLIELFDDKGAVKHSFVLGGTVNSSGGKEDPMAMFNGGGGGKSRFIRILNEDTIWEVANTYADFVNKADQWLSKDFVTISKIKSIEVTGAKPEDGWKASRKAEADTEFTLEGAKPNEKIDTTKADINNLLASPQFDDVLGKDKAAETFKEATKATITTFDGFTYKLQAVKKAVDGADKYFVTFNISGEFAKAREAVKDEKEEDKKKNDESFAASKKALEEKLAKEKEFDGWVYQVTEYTINTLLKKRSEIIKVEEPKSDAPPAAGTPAKPDGTPNLDIKSLMKPSAATAPPPASATTAPVTVTTPPIEVPAPKPTATPADALNKPTEPPASPKVELKPTEPAPAPAEPKK